MVGTGDEMRRFRKWNKGCGMKGGGRMWEDGAWGKWGDSFWEIRK